MKLALALLCVEMDCQEVFESGGSCSCPSCGSRVVLPISRFLNRREAGVAEVPAPASGKLPRHLRLVVPDRALEFPRAIFRRVSGDQEASRAHRVRDSSWREDAELIDFRRSLEEPLAGLEEMSGGLEVEPEAGLALTG